MRDNLVFTGIAEKTEDNPKNAIKEFMQSALKLIQDTINSITFHRVHLIGARNNSRPRPIISKFDLYNQKQFVKSRSKELKGNNCGMND